jgi:predicted nicotinamide N-methyase
LVPELRLYTSDAVTPLWHASAEYLESQAIAPPYWAFPWPGGSAVARFILDAPTLVRGRHVLDFACGGGIVALAAARAGAASVHAYDIDPVAIEACRLNADLNSLRVIAELGDFIGSDLRDFDVIFAGDVCYEQPMATNVLAWLRNLAAAGKMVVLGDPGRTYRPTLGLTLLATHSVPTSLDLEDAILRETAIWQVLGAPDNA